MRRGQLWAVSHRSRLLSLLAVTAFVIVACASLSGWAGEQAFTISYEKYYDKVLGEWEGKCCGAALGAPISGWNYQRIAKEYAEIRDYIAPKPVPGFGPDDQTTYQIIGLHSLEEFGSDVTSAQLAGEWLNHLDVPAKGMRADQIARRKIRDGVMPPESGKHSASEDVGGQMRGEIWGLVCPGDPVRAAQYGQKDGIVGNAGNGVYGEMFMAAVAAEAFKFDAASWKGDAKKANVDIRKLLEAGLRQIPPDCQYAAVVRWVMQMHQDGVPWREALRRIVEKYPTPCNPLFGDAGIVCLGLLYGDGDFEKSLCITAMCGQETECDTANVGAVLGCLHGAKALPEKWTKPLGNSFRCFGKNLLNWTEWKLTELAAQICRTGAWVSPDTVKQPER